MSTQTTAHTLRLPAAPRWPAPVRIALGMVGFLVLLIGLTSAVAVIGQAIGAPAMVVQVAGSVLFAASTIGLVAGLARLDGRGGAGRRPLAELGLRWSAHDARSLALCTGAAVIAMVLVGLIARLTGGADAVPGLDQLSAGQLVGGFAFALIPAFVMQAFPEELFYRGYVLNAARVRVPVAVAVSSILFGSVHVLSQSPATGVLEKFVLYPLMAVGLGFACCCARIGTGSLWAAVGIHGGMHMGNQIASLVAAPQWYGGYLILQILMFVALGLLLLAGRRRLDRAEERIDRAEPCSTVAA